MICGEHLCKTVLTGTELIGELLSDMFVHFVSSRRD